MPGLGGTEGQEADEKQWSRTMRALQSGVREAGALVWVVNAAATRGVEARKTMLRSMRLTFGVGFYEHLLIPLNFFSHS